MFDGVSQSHFDRIETPEGLARCLAASYKTFCSLIRYCNITGLIDPISALFPHEYSTKDLSVNIDRFLTSDSRCFGSRTLAEATMLPKRNHILEIGVAQGSHAISLIRALQPLSYTGVDMNFAQLTEDSMAILKQASSNGVTITLLNQSSSEALANLSQHNTRFDIIYIDANHWHSFVADELSYIPKLLNSGGTVVLNDYTDWFVGSMEPCGVKVAVDEFLVKNFGKFSLSYYAISDCDIAFSLNC